MLKIGDQIEVLIEKMSLHGGAVTRYAGLVIFIAKAAVGDRLLVEITSLKKNHAFGKIIRILSPSPERIQPDCTYFSSCGGCSWQHISYENQLRWKEQLVQELIEKAWQHPVSFLKIRSAPKTFRYRNRIQLKKIKSAVGYFAPHSHELVEVKDCLIAEDILIPQIEKLKMLKPRPTSSEFETWELSRNEAGAVDLLPLDKRTPAFSQVNSLVNQMIIEDLLSWCESFEFKQLWDLYCGSGNFTFPILEKYKHLTGLGVEGSAESIEIAQKKMQSRHISSSKFQFYCSDVALFMRRMSPNQDALVLVDPPRAGLDDKTLLALHESKIKNLFYLSCDPMTLSRDLSRFRELSQSDIQLKKPWTIEKIRCYDMFPQTEHVEVLVQMSR